MVTSNDETKLPIISDKSETDNVLLLKEEGVDWIEQMLYQMDEQMQFLSYARKFLKDFNTQDFVDIKEITFQEEDKPIRHLVHDEQLGISVYHFSQLSSKLKMIYDEKGGNFTFEVSCYDNVNLQGKY